MLLIFFFKLLRLFTKHLKKKEKYNFSSKKKRLPYKLYSKKETHMPHILLSFNRFHLSQNTKSRYQKKKKNEKELEKTRHLQRYCRYIFFSYDKCNGFAFPFPPKVNVKYQLHPNNLLHRDE